MSYSEGNDFVAVTKKKAKKRKHDDFNEYTSPEVHIKTESDTDHSSYKKKSKKSKLKHKFSMKLEKNGTDDESFLDVKVKEENSKLKLFEDCRSIKNENVKSDDSDVNPIFKKPKKKKHKTLYAEQSDVGVKENVKHKNIDKSLKSKEIQMRQAEQSALQSDGNTSQAECQSTEGSFSEASHKRKKKKHNKMHHKEIKVLNNMDIEDHFSSEDTVIITPIDTKKKKKHTKRPHEEIKVFNNMKIEDHFSSEETVIITPRKSKDSFKKKRLSEQIVFEDEDELHISNSQISSKSEDVPLTNNSQSISEDEPLTNPTQPRHESERHSRNSQSSENEDEPHTRNGERSPARDNRRGLKKQLSEYVSSVAGCAVEGAGAGARLDAGEEAWLVAAPRGLAARDVRWVELGAGGGGGARLKAGGARLVAAGAGGAPERAHAAVLAGRAVRWLPLHGALRFHYKLHKHNHAQAHAHAHDNHAAAIPLPTTKTRHPLFGADYTAAILIPESVTEKLEDARRVKKSKKQKKVNGNVTPHEDIDEVDLVRVEKSKKKRKRQPSSECPAAGEGSGEGEGVESSRPKHKKKKKRRAESGSGDVWRCERDMADTLFSF